MDAGSLHCTTPDEFAAARDRLLADVVPWATAAGLERNLAEELAHHIELALDWKFSYADRHLGRWTEHDVEDLLFSWCPAKLSATAEQGGEVSPTLAQGPVEELARLPATTGFARCWLVDHGLAAPSTSFDAEDVSWFPDALAYRMLTGGPEALLDTLALAGPDEGQRALIDRLWRSPSPATETVLVAIGEVHPVKAVAKAARKAALQHRTWRANR